jgi:hypothetical protein
MRLYHLGTLCLVRAASLHGQYKRGHHFSWQDSCFKNPRLPYCIGHESTVDHRKEKRDAADVDQTLRALGQVRHVAISLHDQEIVIMVAGLRADATAPVVAQGWKAVPVVGNSLLVGHAEAVGRALQRIEEDGPPAELTHAAQ